MTTQRRRRPWGRIVCFGGAFLTSLGVQDGLQSVGWAIVCAALLISGVALYGIARFRPPGPGGYPAQS